MIEAVRKGNLFDSGAQTLVNTVNLVGVMGKGIALQFKQRFPDMFADYQRRCAAGQVRLGEPYLWQGPTEPWVINFPTKGHWRSVSKLTDIERGLAFLAEHLAGWRVTSLAVPPLGAGSGGLDWSTVGPAIYRHLTDVPIPVVLYAPFEVPDEQATVAFLAGRAMATSTDGQPQPAIAPGWLVIAEITRRIDQDRHAWPVGRVRLQKLAYFAEAAGVPTGLRFDEGSYGPFAQDLTKALSQLVNDGLLTEARLGRMLAVRPGPAFDHAIAGKRRAIEPHEEAVRRVVDLLARLDSEHTEIAASVHFAAEKLAGELGRRPTEREVLERVQRWKQRRRPPIGEAEVVVAIRDLAALGWIQAAPSTELPPGDDLVTVA
jgi:O-acetyl-ADP-ribose deacetylase (regulator of RNase III)